MDKIKDVNQETEEIDFRWFGHIMIREDTTFIKEVFNWILTGNRSEENQSRHGSVEYWIAWEKDMEDWMDRKLWKKKAVSFLVFWGYTKILLDNVNYNTLNPMLIVFILSYNQLIQ